MDWKLNSLKFARGQYANNIRPVILKQLYVLPPGKIRNKVNDRLSRLDKIFSLYVWDDLYQVYTRTPDDRLITLVEFRRGNRIITEIKNFIIMHKLEI